MTEKYTPDGRYSLQWELELTAIGALWVSTADCEACGEAWEFWFDNRDEAEPEKKLSGGGGIQHGFRLCMSRLL